MRYVFCDYTLDTQRYELRDAETLVALRARVVDLLAYLIAHRDRVVPRQELLDQLWPDQFVGESALSSCIKAARQAVGDDSRTQRIIQTVHGRGFRFIAAVTVEDATLPLGEAGVAVPPPAPETSDQPPALLVGREAAFTQLHQWYATASRGWRQVGFITGEAGIGKTALVDAFVAWATAKEDVWVGHGQCIDHYGAGEPYLPVLEALGRLCREAGGEQLLELLRQHAPSWLVQMPALLPIDARDTFQHLAGGVTQARMLRELTEALEILTAVRPLILVLEDLHWSDVSTLDWLAYVVRRRDPARLLILGTYRPVESLASGHPLRTMMQELRQHGHGVQLVLDSLCEAEVAAYLAHRFAGQVLPDGIARVLHQRTSGHPLFLIALVEEMLRQGERQEGTAAWSLYGGLDALVVEVPASIRHLIEQQLAHRQPADQALLEAASVVGAEFSTAAVAAGLDQTAEEIETQCAALARQKQFMHAHGLEEWPDGTVAARYSFLHALYQEVLYAQVSAGRRMRLHQQIGLRLEAGYGTRAREIAAELAMHFLRGRDTRRAVQYLLHAGENARHRSAYHEAIKHFKKGLEVLTTLTDDSACMQLELDMQIALGNAFMATKGWAAPEVEHAYVRARELCHQMRTTSQLFPVWYGLCAFYFVQAKLQTALELGDEFLDLAQRQPDPAPLLVAHRVLGVTLFYRAEFGSARLHLQRCLALYDPLQHRSLAFLYGQDPEVAGLSFLAWTLWLLGYPDQALARAEEAIRRAQALSHPFSLAYALTWAAVIRQHRQEVQATQERAEAVITLSTAQGFTHLLAFGTILRSWARVGQGQRDGSMAQMRRGLDAWRATGAGLHQPYFLGLLATSAAQYGHADDGLQNLLEAIALAEALGERWWASEIYRLKGEFLLAREDTGREDTGKEEAQSCLLKALDIARQQQAKVLELRAAMSLGRLWQQQGRRDEARQLLAPIYGWFTEGFDTVDLQEAQLLLEALDT